MYIHTNLMWRGIKFKLVPIKSYFYKNVVIDNTKDIWKNTFKMLIYEENTKKSRVYQLKVWDCWPLSSLPSPQWQIKQEFI